MQKRSELKMEIEEKIKNSIRIEFMDYNGNKHLYYNEETPDEQVKFIGFSMGNFLKSVGWPEETVKEVLKVVKDNS